MTLLLEMGTEPHGLPVKTFGIGKQIVYLGDYEIPFTEFFETIFELLTDPQIGNNNAYVHFITYLRSFTVVDGFTEIFEGKKLKTKRLATELPCSPDEEDDSLFVGGFVQVHDYKISIPDFYVLLAYLLSNSNLQKNDPRLEFLEKIKQLH